MDLVRFLWGFARHYKGWMAVIVVAVVLYGLASTATVALIEPIFSEVLLGGPDEGAAPDAPSKAPGAPGPWSALDLKRHFDRAYQGLKRAFGVDASNVHVFTPLLVLVVFLARGLTNFVSEYAFQRIGLGVTDDVRNRLYRRVLEQSARFHAQHGSGELTSRLVNDVNLIQLAVSQRLFDLVQQGVTLLLLLALLLSTDFKLAVACLLATPPLVYAIVRFGQSMRRSAHRAQERMAELIAILSEGIRGHRVVKAFGMEAFEARRFREACARYLKINLRAQRMASLSSPVIESITAVGIAAFLLYAGAQVRSGELTAPLLVQFMANLLLLYDPLRKLNRVNLLLQQALASAQRLQAVLAVENDIADRPGAHDVSGVGQGLAFEGVGFAYKDVPVLDGIDLRIARGEIVALVGPSGAGKSTLVNLLPRFFDPDRGRVTLDGTDLRELRLASLRAQIGMVTQDVVLFNDSVRNNIAYGRSDLPLERVREAARAACADEFIQQLPQGYDTQVGEWGMELSGGQRQRLAIARALLKDAPILILDEATSHLDAESEAAVQQALYNLMHGRTTLVIAHRLSTILEADRIVVMEGGRIVDQGTHAELLERGGTYRRLFELQFAPRIPA